MESDSIFFHYIKNSIENLNESTSCFKFTSLHRTRSPQKTRTIQCGERYLGLPKNIHYPIQRDIGQPAFLPVLAH
jgi:hypothetical protein